MEDRIRQLNEKLNPNVIQEGRGLTFKRFSSYRDVTTAADEIEISLGAFEQAIKDYMMDDIENKADQSKNFQRFQKAWDKIFDQINVALKYVD